MSCKTLFILTVSLASALSISACSKPEAPDKEQPPEPQVTAGADDATQLRDAIQEPIDKARAAEEAVQDASEAQRAAIDAAGG